MSQILIWHFMIYCHSDHLFVQDCHSRTKTFANIFTCHKNSPMHEIPNYRTGPAKVWSSPGFNGPLGPDRLPFPVLKFPFFSRNSIYIVRKYKSVSLRVGKMNRRRLSVQHTIILHNAVWLFQDYFASNSRF